MDKHKSIRSLVNDSAYLTRLESHGSVGELRTKGLAPATPPPMVRSSSRPDLLAPSPVGSPTSMTIPRVATVSTIPHQSLTSKNEEWYRIQTAIVSLFQGRKLEDGQMAKLLENIRNMVASDVGPFIYEYFKNQLLKRGLVIMRESLRDREGLELLIALGELWRNFFRQILPTLEILLRPIQTTEFSIRQVSLLTFRDVIVLKFFSELTGVLKNTATVSPPIRQMFLILQGINEGFPPTENRLQLECLVGLAVNPYIGFKGIYFGSSEPAIEATEEAYRKKSSITKPPFLPFQSRQLSIDVQRLPENNVWGLYKRYGHVRQASIPDVKLHLRLHELKQDDAPRRYSYDDYAKT